MKSLFSILLLASITVHAHTLPPEVKAIVDEVATLTGDLERGKILAQNCSACHGDNGLPENSTTTRTPYVADQTPTYTAIQLASFKTGHRQYKTMNSVSSRLSSQDITDLIAFYSSYEARNEHCKNNGAAYDLDEFAAGKLLAKTKRDITVSSGKVVQVSCTQCHGQDGVMPEESRQDTKHPDLAGLGRKYVYTQISGFAAGTKQAGPMAMIAKGLTEDQINALSTYYSNMKRCR